MEKEYENRIKKIHEDASKKFEEVRSKWIEKWKHDSYKIFEVISNEDNGVYLDKHKEYN